MDQMMNFDQNPFQAIVDQGKQQMMPQKQSGGMMQNMDQGQEGQQQSALTPSPIGKTMAGGNMGPAPENQLNPGETGDQSKSLIGAIQSLENFIKASTDKDEIATVRSVVALLARLMYSDQQKMAGKLS